MDISVFSFQWSKQRQAGGVPVQEVRPTDGADLTGTEETCEMDIFQAALDHGNIPIGMIV